MLADPDILNGAESSYIIRSTYSSSEISIYFVIIHLSLFQPSIIPSL